MVQWYTSFYFCLHNFFIEVKLISGPMCDIHAVLLGSSPDNMSTKIDFVMRSKYDQRFAVQQLHIQQLDLKLRQLDQKLHQLVPKRNAFADKETASTVLKDPISPLHLPVKRPFIGLPPTHVTGWLSHSIPNTDM